MTNPLYSGMETTAPPLRQPHAPEERRSLWAGWVFFGAVMAILLGAFQIIEGLTALFRHNYFIVSHNGLLVTANYTAWGWAHFFLGVLLAITGIGMLAGATWARFIAIVLAALSAIFNLAFIAAYPIWSTVVIAFDVILIYALAAHGHDLREPR